MEALETVVGYWEDALNAYRSNSVAAASDKGAPPPPMLTTAEETVFVRLLENILEGAYQLQVREGFFLLGNLDLKPWSHLPTVDILILTCVTKSSLNCSSTNSPL